MKKVIKNNFRILKKTHAYLQTILKAPVKFQTDRTKTVGGVKGTRYLLKIRNHAPRTTLHAPRATHHGKPKTVSLRFSSTTKWHVRPADPDQPQHPPSLISVFVLLIFAVCMKLGSLLTHWAHSED